MARRVKVADFVEESQWFNKLIIETERDENKTDFGGFIRYGIDCLPDKKIDYLEVRFRNLGEEMSEWGIGNGKIEELKEYAKNAYYTITIHTEQKITGLNWRDVILPYLSMESFPGEMIDEALYELDKIPDSQIWRKKMGFTFSNPSTGLIRDFKSAIDRDLKVI